MLLDGEKNSSHEAGNAVEIESGLFD